MLLDGSSNQPAGLSRVEVALLLYLVNRIGQIHILDRFRHPCGVMPSPEMVQPCRVIHAFSDLHEQDEVLRAQVQLSGRSF